jgi:hypothetical protein
MNTSVAWHAMQMDRLSNLHPSSGHDSAVKLWPEKEWVRQPGTDGEQEKDRAWYLEHRLANYGQKQWGESGGEQTRRPPKPTLPHQKKIGKYGPKYDW